MIIPPDPEKDPNLFDPSASTPSLVPPPSEPSDTEITPPERARTRNAAFGYPYTNDDLGLGYNGEALPPYVREGAAAEGDVFADPPNMRERPINTRRSTPGIIIPIHNQNDGNHGMDSPDDDLTPIASTSRTHLPAQLQTPSSTASASKIWESSTMGLNSGTPSRKGKGKERWSIPLRPKVSPSTRRWWKKWRWWVYVGVALLLAGLGVMTGLLVGLKANRSRKDAGGSAPWKDLTPDGKRQNWVSVS